MIDSPCTGVCRLNAKDICIGCGRDIEEIIVWSTAPDELKQSIIANASQRLAAIANEPAKKN